MKILAALFGLALMTTPLSAYAESKMPEDFLMTSLGKITVCVRSQKFGIAKLSGMVKQMQAEEPEDKMIEDHKKILLTMIGAISDLQDITESEKTMGIILISELINGYDHTLTDINASMKPIVEKTDTTMKDLLKDVTEYDEFNKVFVPKMAVCTTEMEKIVKSAEDYMKVIEN